MPPPSALPHRLRTYATDVCTEMHDASSIMFYFMLPGSRLHSSLYAKCPCLWAEMPRIHMSCWML